MRCAPNAICRRNSSRPSTITTSRAAEGFFLERLIGEPRPNQV
jgi:hypothetical protein